MWETRYFRTFLPCVTVQNGFVVSQQEQILKMHDSIIYVYSPFLYFAFVPLEFKLNLP